MTLLKGRMEILLPEILRIKLIRAVRMENIFLFCIARIPPGCGITEYRVGARARSDPGTDDILLAGVPGSAVVSIQS